MKSFPIAGVIGCCLLLPAFAAGDETPPVYQQSLEEAVAGAMRHSSRLQAKRLEQEAAQSRIAIAQSPAWPRLSLDASFRYVTEVPEIAVAPNRPAIPMGDNENYSVGPVLSWTFWDTGAGYFAAKAATAAAEAKAQEVEAITREIRLKTRLAYFQTQHSLVHHRLLKASLKLSQDQYRDILSRKQAGAASRMDVLSGHQEVLNQQRQLRQATADLTSMLRELLRLTGGGEGLDLSRPDSEGTPAAGTPAATLQVRLDPLERSLQALGSAATGKPDPQHPQARLFARLAEANRLISQSLGFQHWPKLQLSAKTSLDYPNGPVLETIHQNTLSVAASWPLFEGFRVVNQTQEQDSLAKANEQQAAQAGEDLLLAWNKAQDALASLRDLQALDQRVIAETQELAGLVYDAYRAGRVSFLEVESANHRALAAQIQSVRTSAQMLMQLATLESLREE